MPGHELDLDVVRINCKFTKEMNEVNYGDLLRKLDLAEKLVKREATDIEEKSKEMEELEAAEVYWPSETKREASELTLAIDDELEQKVAPQMGKWLIVTGYRDMEGKRSYWQRLRGIYAQPLAVGSVKGMLSLYRADMNRKHEEIIDWASTGDGENGISVYRLLTYFKSWGTSGFGGSHSPDEGYQKDFDFNLTKKSKK